MPDQPTAGGSVNPSGAGAASPVGALTEERVQEIVVDVVRSTVNSAVTSQLKRALPKELESAMGGLKESFGSMLGEAIGPIQKQLEAKQKAEQEERDKSAQQGKPTATQPNPELESLKKALADQKAEQERFRAQWQAQVKEANDRAEQEKRKAVEATGMNNLRAALGGVVQPDAIGMVADLLCARKQVEIDDEGNVRMKFRGSLSKGMPEEDHVLPISEALPHWKSTKEAAYFLPPPNPSGAGNGAGARPPVGSNGAPPKAEGGDASDAFARRFGKPLDQLI